MTTMRRLRVTWDGLGNLPGLSTFYYGPASPNVSDCVAFFTAIKGLFPTGLTWTIPSTGDEIEDSTGALTGTWVGSGGGTVAANGGALAFAAGTGARTIWRTGVIHRGRRVAGSTFLAPITTAQYTASGTVLASAVTTIQAAAAAFVASGVAKGVWSRPVGGAGGLYCAINAAETPGRVTSLRSRRN